MEQMQVCPLFGGALCIALPARFSDVSKFRQVPDNQEVFADAATDQSFIIELVEMAEEATDDQAAAFHFGSIAQDNDAANASAVEQPSMAEPLPPPHQGIKSVCWGIQNISKFNEGHEKTNQIRVHVACFRLKNVQTDCIVSFNTPVVLNPESSSAEQVEQQAAAFTNPAFALQLFQNALGSFNVLDYSLFQA